MHNSDANYDMNNLAPGGGLKSLFIKAVRYVSLPLELFIRRDFGERHLSLSAFLIGGLWLGLFALGSGLISYAAESLPFKWQGKVAAELGGFSLGMGVIFLLYLILGFLHHSRINWRTAAGLDKHSYEWGKTWLADTVGYAIMKLVNPLHILWMRGINRFQKREDRAQFPKNYPGLTDHYEFTEKYLEPIGVIAIAVFMLFSGSIMVALWLYFSAFFLTVSTFYRYFQLREKQLDIINGQLAANALNDFAQGRKNNQVRITGSQQRTLRSMGEAVARQPELVAAYVESDDPRQKVSSMLSPKLQAMQEQNRQRHLEEAS